MSPSIIAHRGASGYVPEHTLAAKALAYAMGADFLEQDVVASRDDQLIVLHDVHLDRVSNVAEAFPKRARADGRYYVRDFDLRELRELTIWERMNDDGTRVYPNRFPARSGSFQIHTFADELELVRTLNAAIGGSVGVYPEIKRPAWHKDEGVDMAPLFLDTLWQFGYRTPDDNAFIQCFDAAELRRIRDRYGCKLRLVQLIGENSWSEADTDYNALRAADGLQQLAQYVQGIGPWINLLYRMSGANLDEVSSSGLAEAAHAAGLVVHPYTVRSDDLPAGFDTLEKLLAFLLDELDVDGVFTDFPDQVRQYVNAAGA